MFPVFIVFDVTVKQKQTQYESKDTMTVNKGFWVWVIYETLDMKVRGHELTLDYHIITNRKIQRDPPCLYAVEEYVLLTLDKTNRRNASHTKHSKSHPVT